MIPYSGRDQDRLAGSIAHKSRRFGFSSTMGEIKPIGECRMSHSIQICHSLTMFRFRTREHSMSAWCTSEHTYVRGNCSGVVLSVTERRLFKPPLVVRREKPLQEESHQDCAEAGRGSPSAQDCFYGANRCGVRPGTGASWMLYAVAAEVQPLCIHMPLSLRSYTQPDFLAHLSGYYLL